ncbi:MAG: Ribosomal RNA small subunit methyltransferase Nep1 [Candidatus Bathyarchaeota archaeon BA2]|nr:MAG: Ribosomal RNA small subunit methyltransferase Nep1 [Candidatus Bathyarchaeota archaeon BA2]
MLSIKFFIETGFSLSEGSGLLILILAESALEPVPRGLWRHPAIKRHSKRHGKPPQFILLDRSYHHFAMKNLKESEKRGRPDIVHFALLEALGSPLNKEGLLQVYVHTINDYVITVNPEARLPRNYNRFIGLIEQLFESGRVPSTGQTLLRLERKTLPKLLREIKSDYVVAFSRKGSPKTLKETVSKLLHNKRPAVIIGGFPHGHFSETTSKLASEVICIDPGMLETWTLTSRVIYEYERTIFLPKKRLKP